MTLPEIFPMPALSAKKWRARAQMQGMTTRILINAFMEDASSISDVFYAFSE
jgi:hypothetical protein